MVEKKLPWSLEKVFEFGDKTDWVSIFFNFEPIKIPMQGLTTKAVLSKKASNGKKMSLKKIL